MGAFWMLPMLSTGRAGSLCLLSFLFGLFVGGVIIWSSVVQLEQVEIAYKSRVVSISVAISVAAVPLANFLLGALCNWMSIPAIFGVSGLLMILVFLFFSRRKPLRAL